MPTVILCPEYADLGHLTPYNLRNHRSSQDAEIIKHNLDRVLTPDNAMNESSERQKSIVPAKAFQQGPLGLASYQRSFNLQFIRESDVLEQRDSRIRVLVSNHRYGMRWDLAGKSVAVVGNGLVRNCGSLIDECDEVIRISTMRNWLRAPEHDGTRTTIWAGHPWLVVSRMENGEIRANPSFARLAEEGTQLWATSPFHISLDSYKWLKNNGQLDRLLVAPSSAEIYEIACSLLESSIIEILFSISKKEGLIGFSRFELLLTGTRILMMLYMCGVKSIHVFGSNLFNFSRKDVWFGHDLNFDYRILMYLKRRIEERGGKFYWNEEREVKRARNISLLRFWGK